VCLEGPHTITIKVTCGKAGPNTNGSCAIQDEPGYDTASYDASDFDHTVTITGVQQYPIDRRNGISVNGVFQYHALAAGNSPGVTTTEWIGGVASGSSAVAPSALREQADSPIPTTHSESLPVKALDTDDGNFEGRFSIFLPPPPGARLFLVTVTACGNKKDSRVLSYEDNECQTSGTTSCPAACEGRPIRLSNGNMRMTDQDPLPGSEQFPMRRTYDLRGAAPGPFGYGWTTPFDARLTSFQSSGRDFLDIRTTSNSEYVFQNIGDTWTQMWPKGTAPATLVPGSNTYTLREPRSVIETVFDSVSGHLIRIHSRASGRDVILSYVNGVPAHASDSWGNWGWTLSADGANRIATIAVDGTSLVWTYNYGNEGSLASVLGPSGAAWRTYTYWGGPSFHGFELKEARDARGNLIESHEYQAGTNNTLSSISDRDDITSVSYERTGRDQFETVTRTTSGTGATTDYYIRSIADRPRTVQVIGHCATCGTDDAVFAYDAATGQMLREQDARGYITVRTFDLNDRVTSVAGPYRPAGCDPVSDAAHCRQAPTSLLTVDLLPTNATITTGYAYGDANWPDIVTLTSTNSALTPSQVRTTAVDLDPATGTVTRQVVTGITGIPAEAAEYTTTTTLYDGTAGTAFDPGGAFDAAWTSLPQPAGLRRSTDGPRTDVSDTTTWVYYPIDPSVPASWRGHLAAIRNAAGHTTRFENYDVFGNAARVVDANGVATEQTFDAMGRVLTSTLKSVAGCDTAADPLCATDLVSSRTYLPALGPLATTTLPGGGTTSYDYDSLGRTTATTRQITASAYERIEYDFDTATGRKSAERYLAGHPGSWTVTRSDAFQYDSFARLSEIDHPDGTKIVYHYDGASNVSTVQDERHTTANTSYAYDASNRLAAVTQTLSTASGGQIVTAYAYDIHGNLTSVIDPNGNVTSYVYDDFGRMLSQTSPVTGATNYTYDPSGNLLMTTDANGVSTTRSYDALNPFSRLRPTERLPRPPHGLTTALPPSLGAGSPQ
jgi:YD repeat-containing protein